MHNHLRVLLFLSLLMGLVAFQPGGVTFADSAASRVLVPVSYSTEKGSASGSAASLGTQDQSGTADKPAAYVTFKTPGTIYRGYSTYKLPSGVQAASLTTIQVLVNYKGAAASKQTWSWRLYNWNNGNWVAAGNNSAAKKDTWSYLTFSIGNPTRFFSSKGELRLQLFSGDSAGDARIDYSAVKLVSASSGPTSTPAPKATATPDPAKTATAAPAATKTNPPAPTATGSIACASYNASFEATMLGLINKARADNGLPALKLQSQLTAAARGHSADMACNGYTAHDAPDGTTSTQRIEQQGYKWSWHGENIAWGFGTAADVMNLWMSDVPHKANILSANYTEIGVGYAYSAKSAFGNYWTVDFAKPK